LAYLGAQLATGVPIGLGLGLWMGLGARQLGPEGVATLRHLSVILSALLGQVVGGIVALRLALRGGSSSGGLARFGLVEPRLGHVAAAGLLGLGLSAVYLFVMLVRFPPMREHPWGPFASAALAEGWPQLLWAITALLIAPPIEELVFRGVLLAGFVGSLGR